MSVITLLEQLEALDQDLARTIKSVGKPVADVAENRQTNEKTEVSNSRAIRILFVVVKLGWRRFQIAKFRKRLMNWYGEN